MPTRFIPEELVLTIHADLLNRYGGLSGVRDRHLLDSALAQPRMTAGGKFPHRTVFHKAAAYGFHVTKNHPFVDGNKRVAFALMDIFLYRNGWDLKASEKDAYAMMIAVTTGTMSKKALSSWLRTHAERTADQ